ncbi:solute carrier family 23 member 1-like [Ptychodera flava]|uniref:solute carrier family 23 member 1-like n=1 Tax=Ptychodera flava TaxID=63121 RepID=UPI00396A3B3D
MVCMLALWLPATNDDVRWCCDHAFSGYGNAMCCRQCIDHREDLQYHGSHDFHINLSADNIWSEITNTTRTICRLLLSSLVFLSQPQWRCPEIVELNGNISANESGYEDVGWKVRMREVQGAIIISSSIEFILGLSGLMGLLLRFIGPLTVAPIIVLIGLGIYSLASLFASNQWGIAFLTFGLIILFSQYLRKVPVPIPVWTRGKGCRVEWLRLFNLFPVILGIGLAWLTCWIFTVSNVFPEGHTARTDIRSSAIADAPWVTFPLPGQWGTPRVSIALVFGMLSGIIASAVESIGDYYACARLSGASPPPPHAVNRGICIEGFCCILSGIWGSGLGTTSFSENIGAIAITKVGSRRVMQWTSLLLLISGIFGKFGAILATLPLPIVGGALIAIFSIILAAGTANLQFVNMNSSRSLCIFGTAVFCGVMIPSWVEANPGAIDTGNDEADQIIEVLLKTGMFVAGFIGFFLDNTIPGTPEERGLLAWHSKGSSEGDGNKPSCYELPWCLSNIRQYKWSRYVPFCPGFMEKRRQTTVDRQSDQKV